MNKAITALAALAALLAMAPSAAGAAPPLFGTTEFRAKSLAALPKWQRALRQIDQERSTYRGLLPFERQPVPRTASSAWQSVIESQIGRPQIDQLHAINRFLNDWRYKPDDQNYGQRDYWATPLEFLRRSGDCEDYAIAKYVTLRELGIRAGAAASGRGPGCRARSRPCRARGLPRRSGVHSRQSDQGGAAAGTDQPITCPTIRSTKTTRWAHVPPAEAMLAARSAADDAPAPKPTEGIMGSGRTRSSHGRSGGRSALRSRARAAGRPAAGCAVHRVQPDRAGAGRRAGRGSGQGGGRRAQRQPACGAGRADGSPGARPGRGAGHLAQRHRADRAPADRGGSAAAVRERDDVRGVRPNRRCPRSPSSSRFCSG